MKGSCLSIPYRKKARLIKNIAKESENGMYSTLLILITKFWKRKRMRESISSEYRKKAKAFSELTMMSRGKANMEIRDATLKYPTNNCRAGESKSSRLMKTIEANTAKTDTRNPNIFNFIGFSAYAMKMEMYSVWKTAPMESTVATRMIPGETMGIPYQRQIKQPISCCNVVYKCISRVIVNRLKGFLTEINPAKSELSSSGMVVSDLDAFKDALGIKLGSFPVRYLGIPLVAKRLSVVDCAPLLDKISSKLQQLMLPDAVINCINQLCSRFFLKGEDKLVK
ncbi:hypothetical protein F3Y22_tig00111794pilonHSYRG00090 [Hibiscus syriacus]|uniref:Uncharacterized protein n=1 Tax=Hibiscus syriacus TaxID=106335 RepID=A0A6A2XCC9_HIBSY|nr:hypothetical protein F3Y22_tig00111794pilonHSYRG00090 [Hibiscus syriacus]